VLIRELAVFLRNAVVVLHGCRDHQVGTGPKQIVDPNGVFLVLALLGLLGLVAVAIRRFKRRTPGERWGWERVAFAALIWILATVLLGLPLGMLAFTAAHGPAGTNPWTVAPALLFPLPLYAVVEILLCRWAAR
jgi:sterol desaturase/sphingolipid hydroxylase (fatty acid hydroxylase superfamily)